MNSASRLSFPKRTLAIALSASLAFTSAQVLNTSVFSPSHAVAADADQTNDFGVKIDGVYLRDTNEKYVGEIFKLTPDGKEDKADLQKYKARFVIDLKKFKPGNVVEIKTNGLFGFNLSGSSQVNLPLKVDDIQIGTYDIRRSDAIITFTDGLEKLTQGGETTLDLNLFRFQRTYNTKELLDAAVPPETLNQHGFRKETELPFTVGLKESASDKTFEHLGTVKADNDWNSLFYVAPDYTKRPHYWTDPVYDPSKSGRIDFNYATIQMGSSTEFRKEIKAVVKPSTNQERHKDHPTGEWKFLPESELREGMTLAAYEAPDATKDRRKDAPVPAGMTGDFKINQNGEMEVTFTNVPAGIAPALNFKRTGVSDFRGSAYYGFEQVSLVVDGVPQKNDASYYDRLIPEPAGSQGTKWEAKPGITAAVDGKATQATNPATVSAQGADLTVTLSNAEDATASLSAPTIVLADGTEHEFPDVTINKGESKDVTIKGWKPKGQSAQKITVKYPTKETAETTVFVQFLPVPVLTVEEKPVAGKDTKIEIEVPGLKDGKVEIQLPGGKVETVEIKNGKGELTHTFPTPGTIDLELTAVDPDGNRSATVPQPVTVVPAKPDVKFVDPNTGKETTPAGGKETTIVVEVPEGTTGNVEIELPDGTKNTYPIKDGKVTVPHTFPTPGEESTIKVTVIDSDGNRGETNEVAVTPLWPTDLSSIAELKPECKNALITSGAFAGAGILIALLSQIRIPGIEHALGDVQSKMGIYNEQLANAAREWGPRIGALLGLIAVLAATGDTIAKCSVPGSSDGSSGSSKKEKESAKQTTTPSAPKQTDVEQPTSPAAPSPTDSEEPTTSPVAP